MNNIGLLEQIETSENIEELNSLLTKTSEYKNASEDTKKKWLIAHQNKIKQLITRIDG